MQCSFKTFLGAVAALVITAGSASAALVDVSYRIRRPGTSGTFQPMRYTDENGDVVLLAGSEIVSTRVHLDYTPASADDLAGFDYLFDVPVENPVSGSIHIEPSLLSPIAGTSAYGYDLVTNDHNGTILDTTFGYQLLSGGGDYTENSAVTFTVSLAPEPASLAAISGGITLLARRRR